MLLGFRLCLGCAATDPSQMPRSDRVYDSGTRQLPRQPMRERRPEVLEPHLHVR